MMPLDSYCISTFCEQ